MEFKFTSILSEKTQRIRENEKIIKQSTKLKELN